MPQQARVPKVSKWKDPCPYRHGPGTSKNASGDVDHYSVLDVESPLNPMEIPYQDDGQGNGTPHWNIQ